MSDFCGRNWWLSVTTACWGGAELNRYFLEGLKAGTNLKMMAIIHRSSLGDFPMSANRIVNSSVRELHTCDGSFLRSLLLPNLLTISVKPHFNDSMVTTVPNCPENVLPALHGLILALCCPLRHLTLKSVEYDNGDLLLSVLDIASSLRELVITQHFDGGTYNAGSAPALLPAQRAYRRHRRKSPLRYRRKPDEAHHQSRRCPSNVQP